MVTSENESGPAFVKNCGTLDGWDSGCCSGVGSHKGEGCLAVVVRAALWDVCHVAVLIVLTTLPATRKGGVKYVDVLLLLALLRLAIRWWCMD